MELAERDLPRVIEVSSGRVRVDLDGRLLGPKAAFRLSYRNEFSAGPQATTPLFRVGIDDPDGWTVWFNRAGTHLAGATAYGVVSVCDLAVVQAILRLRAIAEHGATTDFSSPLTAARTNVAPAWLEWLIFPHHVNYHIEHHLYASVPHYHLPRLHREMKARGVLEGAEVISFPATLGKIFSERKAISA